MTVIQPVRRTGALPQDIFNLQQTTYLQRAYCFSFNHEMKPRTKSERRESYSTTSTDRTNMLNAIYRMVIYVSCLSILLLLLPLSCQAAASPIAAVASLRYPVRTAHNNRQRRYTTRGSSYYSEHSLYFPTPFSIATARTRRRDRSSSSSSSTTATQDGSSIGPASPSDQVDGQLTEQQQERQLQAQQPVVTYADLGLLGKIVAGTVEITMTTLFEYATGFLGGYLLGTVTDVPRLLFRPLDPPKPSTFREFSGRFHRMHGKSFRWATSWGGISAAFGGFRVLAKVVRGGKEDEWSNILSSMAAGAYFSRAGACRRYLSLTTISLDLLFFLCMCVLFISHYYKMLVRWLGQLYLL